MRSTVFAAALIALTASAGAQTVDKTAFKTIQGPDEWRMANYIGKPIVNSQGERIGDVNDVLFNRSGNITTVVIGVGGFLGIGEKQVALPYDVVTYAETGGKRQIVVPLSKEALKAAPSYTPTEKTTFEKVQETAGDVANKATRKAGELTDKAMQKLEEYRQKDQDDTTASTPNTPAAPATPTTPATPNQQ